MEKTNKIGILGGTFDPIHTGHLIIAESAYHQCNLDKVLIMPSGISYMKKDRQISSKIDRLNMCRLAVGDNPHLEVSDIEIKREGYTYTADTLCNLTEDHSDNKYYFIVGADTLMNMGSWYHPNIIFNKCSLLVFNRVINDNTDKYDDIAQNLRIKYNADITFIDSPITEISSTDIRNRIKAGEYVRYQLPDPVMQYISQYNLYNGQ